MKFYTHAGRFHADEVVAGTLLIIGNVVEEIVRLENHENLPTDGIIGDIGRVYDHSARRYDHHQEWLTRDDGYPYATAGLIWKHYGEQIVKEVLDDPKIDSKAVSFVIKEVDEVFMKSIDAADSDNKYYTESHCSVGMVDVLTFSYIIDLLNQDDVHCIGNTGAYMKGFDITVDVVESLIFNAYKHYQEINSFKNEVEYRNDSVNIVISKNKNFKYDNELALRYFPDVDFYISPSLHLEGSYQMLAIRPNPKKRDVKIPINRSESFKGFIHNGKWIAGSTSLTDLIHLAEYSKKLYLKGESQT